MSITPEMLAAYADGELGPEECAKVAAAIAADPALDEQVAAHRALRESLSAHFVPILDMPVPERLTELLDKPQTQAKAADVVDLAAMRVAKAERDRAGTRFTMPRWATGGAIAASLAIGLVIGGQLPTSAPVRSADGRLVAGGALDKALTSQLASAQGGQGGVRILLSFKAEDGRYCRGFDAGATSGIACREEGNWALVRTQASGMVGGREYQQAGSVDADIVAAAQDMASGEALDPRAERAARDAGWYDRSSEQR